METTPLSFDHYRRFERFLQLRTRNSVIAMHPYNYGLSRPPIWNFALCSALHGPLIECRLSATIRQHQRFRPVAALELVEPLHDFGPPADRQASPNAPD
jgi:hypothetical protein